MTQSLMTLWSRSMEIASGSPEVVARRVGGLMNPLAVWSPAGALELQSMLLEKVEAAVESWWAMVRGTLSFNTAPQGWDASLWWLPLQHDRITDKAVGAATQVLLPVSERVAANVERLRNG